MRGVLDVGGRHRNEDGPVSDDTVTVFPCPDCGLWMSRMERVETGDGWTETRCWDCGHQFGIWGDKGTLDLGIIRDHEPHTNDLDVFYERFGAVHPFTEQESPE